MASSSALVRKLILTLTLAAALPLLLAALYTGTVTREAVVEVRLQKLQVRLREQAREVAARLQGFREEVRFLGAMAGPGPGEVFPAELEELFLHYVRAKADVVQVRFLDAAGRERLRVNREGDRVERVAQGQLQDKGSSYYVPTILALAPGELYVSPMDLNVEAGVVEQPLRPVIRLATPVAGPDGAVTGMVILNLSGRALLEALPNQSDPGELLLINQAGEYLLHPDPRRTFASQRDDALPAPDRPDLLEQLRAAGDEGFAVDLDGEAAVYTVLRPDPLDPDRGWWLVRVLPRDLLDDTADATVTNLLVLSALALVLALGVGLALGHYWLRRPLLRLTHGLRAMAGGDYTSRVPVLAGEGELAELARDFNTMAAALEDSHRQLARQRDELEAAVVERTRELAQANDRLEELVEELARSRDQARAASLAKSGFLANMSHELRTPLNAVLGLTEMCLDDVRDQAFDDLEEPLERAHRAGRHLLALINDVLDLSKIEAGRLELRLESLSLPPFLDSLMATVQPLAEARGNRLELRREGGPDQLLTDPLRLRQVLINLLSNACKFTDKGKVTLEVGSQAGNPPRLVFRVRDTGIGMDPASVEGLFQEFIQADPSTTRQQGGTGLGLAITRRLVDLMGGSIRVDTAPGQGSTFTVELPLAAGDRPAAAKPARPVALSLQGEDALVLVVDDDQVTFHLVQHALKSQVTVLWARDGVEGLRLAREQHPQVIILDLLMPEVSGWDVLAALKADPLVADIPVIIASILDEDGRAYALGAQDYLVKPLDQERLRGLMERHRGQTDRVLVVDDDPDARRLVQGVLTRRGWTVDLAEDGRQTLERLQADALPDVIILDLLMPVMDGFTVLRYLRTNPPWQDIPVLVLTAAELSVQQRVQLEQGVRGLILKGDCSAEDLIDRLVEILNGSFSGAAGT